MIKHRRVLVFSWPHGLWMLAVFCNLFANWIELWDFRSMEPMPIGAVAVGFSIVVVIYFVCALVAPDFDESKNYDLKDFHNRQGRTYISAFLILVLQSLAVNFVAGGGTGGQNWARQNLAVLIMLLLTALPLFIRTKFVQVACPLGIVLLLLVVVPLYYPVLA